MVSAVWRRKCVSSSWAQLQLSILCIDETLFSLCVTIRQKKKPHTQVKRSFKKKRVSMRTLASSTAVMNIIKPLASPCVSLTCADRSEEHWFTATAAKGHLVGVNLP